MAQDIAPIELSLTAGDLVTLWAPQWREDGEEWEAFLGQDEDLFAFTDVAALVAFVRTVTEHDLSDHPAWPVVAQLPATDLIPDDDHRFDLVGVPELVAQEPDTWVLGELADTVDMLRSLAGVCDLAVIDEVLSSAPGFALLSGGTLAFVGREGQRRWDELCAVVAKRWDEVIDALDALVSIPDVDAGALATAQAELAAAEPAAEATGALEGAEVAGARSGRGDEALGFWSEVGIDPIRIVSGLGEHYTLRCYLDDDPVFLGSNGHIDVFTSPRALIRHLADDPGDHDLAGVATWPRVVERAQAGDLALAVDEGNSYVLPGLDEDLAGGPEAVDAVQLDLAVELITDAEQWAGSKTAEEALAASEPLGWLVSFILRPDPTRLAPSPPFDTEAQAWRALVHHVEERLRIR